MERKVFPVREYLFMTTRNRRQDFIVQYANLPTVSTYKAMHHAFVKYTCLNELISFSNGKQNVC